MRGKGKSVGHSQSSTCSGRKTLKRCKNNGEADNVVLIDVDSDNINNVIVIDIPESLKQKLRGSSDRCKLRTVICIDDDESSDNDHPGMGVEGGGDFYSDASSSGRFFPTSNHTQKSADQVGDECQFVQENLSPLKLSKCKRTYSGKASSRNCYGLGPESDTGSADNDYPDCEFMEDSFGELREQWEKANKKKKYDVRNGQSGRVDQATTSGLHTGSQQKVEVENMTDQHTEARVCPSSSNACYEEENPSLFADFGLKSTEETQFSDSKADNWVREESFSVDPPFNNSEGQATKHAKHGRSSLHYEHDHWSRGFSACSSHEQGNKQVNHTNRFSQDKEKTPPAEPCMTNPDPTIDIHFGCSKTSFLDEEFSFFVIPDEVLLFSKTQHSVDTEVGNGGEKFQQTRSCSSHFPNEFENASGSSVDKEKLASREPSFQNIKPSDQTQVNHGVPDNEVGAIPVETFCEDTPLGESALKKVEVCCQVKVKPVPKEPSFFSIPRKKAHSSPNMGAGELCSDFMSNHQQEVEKDGPLHAQDGDVTNADQGCIINEREKLKETDEYKRAVEEEWASRQRELQVQAEEAQKMRQLRKREKAESMRLLDMERRQKQRVEEMREIQKKDEENMNLKEQLRAEVRKELNQLEIKCRDMASLLRGLGIQVGGGFQPQAHEVRAAYKRALLSFHPDRASGSDIRQLVEAEEKFKLISRMKDKFLSTS